MLDLTGLFFAGLWELFHALGVTDKFVMVLIAGLCLLFVALALVEALRHGRL